MTFRVESQGRDGVWRAVDLRCKTAKIAVRRMREIVELRERAGLNDRILQIVRFDTVTRTEVVIAQTRPSYKRKLV